MKYRKTCNILGVHTAVTDMGKTVSFLEEHLSELRGQYICVANVHTTVMAKENKKYREIQNNAAMVLPDGKPLSVMERRYGHADAGKVSSPDLMAEHENKFPSVMIGVGAGFDFLAGTVKRAPLWMQRSGLEWLHRLFQDPGRLWKRYVVTNTKFIGYMIKQRKEIHGRQ